jgi:hypothetical protein
MFSEVFQGWHASMPNIQRKALSADRRRQKQRDIVCVPGRSPRTPSRKCTLSRWQPSICDPHWLAGPRLPTCMH